MKKPELIGIIISSALSFNSLESLASDSQRSSIEKRPRKIESIVKESVRFIVSSKSEESAKIFDYVNSEGDLISYRISKGIIPVHHYKIEGFNILRKCDCAEVAFIAEEYKIKKKGDLFQVIDLKGRSIAEGEYLTKEGKIIYATTGEKTIKIGL